MYQTTRDVTQLATRDVSLRAARGCTRTEIVAPEVLLRVAADNGAAAAARQQRFARVRHAPQLPAAAGAASSVD